jgi:VanZ family protein
MSKTLGLLRRWLPAIVVMVAIFAFSSVPANELPNFAWADTLVKKGGHMLGYGFLALTFLWALRDGRGNPRHGAVAAWLLTVLYACTDEFHQFFVPGRHSTIVDVGIDALGAAIALVVWSWATRRN